jgi:hypothetical protein
VRPGVTSHRDHTPRPFLLKTNFFNRIGQELPTSYADLKVCFGILIAQTGPAAFVKSFGRL